MTAEHETTEQFARRRMREKMIEELSKECPVCSAMLHRTATADDGLPDGVAFEAAYHCGGRVFVEDDADFSVQQGCERSLASELHDLWEELEADREGLIEEIEDLARKDDAEAVEI